MKAWHFTGANKRLRHGDGRDIKSGRTLKVQGSLAMCNYGLHASKRLIDALRYAPGTYVWRVELGGDIVRDDDKFVASERTALWGYDATDVLRAFARRCALDVVGLWDAPEQVVEYLRTGDESICAAASSAARDAARDAASAARDAASAARDASAARAAWDARDAAWAAWDAAWDARDAWAAKQNRCLTSMIAAHRP